MAYATLSEMKTYLGIDSGITSEDDLITLMIGQAKNLIDAYFMRTFEAEADATRRFHAQRDVRGYRLLLDRDLCQITSVVNGNGETVTSSQYVTSPVSDVPYYAIDLKRSSGIVWTWATDPEASISVTGRWAYSLTASSEVRHLCKYIASAMYRGKDNVPQTGSNRSVAASMDILAGDLPADIRILLSYIPRRGVIA